MAEPVVAVGAFASIVGIVAEFDRMQRRVKRFVKALKHAKDDFSHVLKELDIFTDSLQFLCAVGSREDTNGLDSATRLQSSKIGKKIADAGRRSIEKMHTLLDDASDLRADPKTDRIRYWVACWRWRHQHEEVKPILQYIDSVKLSADLLISIILLDSVLRKAQDGNGTLSKADREQLSMNKRKVRELQAKCKTLEKENDLLWRQLDCPEFQDMTKEIVHGARQLVDSLVHDRKDIDIALNQRQARLRQYFNISSGSVSNTPASDCGTCSARPDPRVLSGQMQPQSPGPLDADNSFLEQEIIIHAASSSMSTMSAHNIGSDDAEIIVHSSNPSASEISSIGRAPNRSKRNFRKPADFWDSSQPSSAGSLTTIRRKQDIIRDLDDGQGPRRVWAYRRSSRHDSVE